MTKDKKEKKDKPREPEAKDIAEKLMSRLNDYSWNQDKELSGYSKEIYDNLQEMDQDDRIETILSVLAHDEDLFFAVTGRFAYETGYTVRMIAEMSNARKEVGPDEMNAWTNAIYAAFGERMFGYAKESMKKFFPEDYKAFEKCLKKDSKKE